MNEFKYGFVDINNYLLEIINFEENDTETMETVKSFLNAENYYELNEPFGPAVIGKSIWTGEYFTPGSPYEKWVWNNEQNLWVAPFDPPNDDKIYDWSDNLVAWVEVGLLPPA